MKKIATLLILLYFYTSCTVFDLYLKDTYTGWDLYKSDFPEMNNIEDVTNYVYELLEYDKYSLYSPEDAIETGLGNCATYTILCSNIAHYTLGEEYGLAAVNISDNRTVVDGGFVNHAVLYKDGKIYSPYTGIEITDVPIRYYYEFWEVFNR